MEQALPEARLRLERWSLAASVLEQKAGSFFWSWAWMLKRSREYPGVEAGVVALLVALGVREAPELSHGFLREEVVAVHLQSVEAEEAHAVFLAHWEGPPAEVEAQNLLKGPVEALVEDARAEPIALRAARRSSDLANRAA